jgi:hypothetical protein
LPSLDSDATTSVVAVTAIDLRQDVADRVGAAQVDVALAEPLAMLIEPFDTPWNVAPSEVAQPRRRREPRAQVARANACSERLPNTSLGADLNGRTVLSSNVFCNTSFEPTNFHATAGAGLETGPRFDRSPPKR